MFDPTKPAQTLNGLPARILCTDFKFDQPIVAAILYPDGHETIRFYYRGGVYALNGLRSENDLVNVLPIPDQFPQLDWAMKSTAPNWVAHIREAASLEEAELIYAISRKQIPDHPRWPEIKALYQL